MIGWNASCGSGWARGSRSTSWPALYRDQAETLLDRATARMSEDEPLADASAACDAAFYLYMREASDFGGGRSGPRRVGLLSPSGPESG